MRKHGGAVEFDLFDHGYPDIHELGTPRFTFRRLRDFLNNLPRESATTRAAFGDAVRWSDGDHLAAMTVDLLAQVAWMYAGVHAKNPPRRPPQPVRRPGDVSTVDGMTATRNLSERTMFTSGSLSLAELDAAIERQTGARRGIAEEVL